MSKQGVQDVPRSPAHQVAGNAIMLRPGPNCTDHRDVATSAVMYTGGEEEEVE